MRTDDYYNQIRNFAIIAHIDHGKSTLADRMLDLTGTIPRREMKERVLDTLELEQERGITIKLQTARMICKYTGNKLGFQKDEPFILNLIDTPGHVDFAYEVSRSLAASEAAILLVDATQGIQAQTLTTVYKALEYNLTIIPVINKIDLPSAQIDLCLAELSAAFGFTPEEIILTSGKTGEGVKELLDRIIELCPPPHTTSKLEMPTRMLIYDSFYDEYKGVVILVKVVDGVVRKVERLITLENPQEIEQIELGYITPNLVETDELRAGEVGYIATGLKDIRLVHVGDTLTCAKFKEDKSITPLPGYKQPKPMVYASLFPVVSDDFEEFSKALGKLSLNDAALYFKRENSTALGSGYMCGFLGLLHLEITQERLEKEFNIDLISTTPTVDYKIWLNTSDMSKVPELTSANKNEDGSFNVRSASEFPDKSLINRIEEPWVKLELITPDQYIGDLMELCQKQRGIYRSMEFLTTDPALKGHKHVILRYVIPTAEIITSFFDKLKSISQGYASMDYTFLEYQESDIIKVQLLINYEQVEPLSYLSHSSNAEQKAHTLVDKLKELLPKQQFKVPIQAAIGGKVIARETVQQYRKDVIAKLYGGDVTRKMKLLEKQRKGKKKLKSFGKVEIPKEVFLGALKA